MIVEDLLFHLRKFSVRSDYIKFYGIWVHSYAGVMLDFFLCQGIGFVLLKIWKRVGFRLRFMFACIFSMVRLSGMCLRGNVNI
ncbi:hypothetical protein BGX38DRAFT_1161959 [Terfezia claveryi]|nr:hypothetical protein BGX38DRAFT_1161959 [Terfezia claveryi]